MAIYECRVLFKASSPTVHHSPKRNPANTCLCAGYGFWTPTAAQAGSCFNNGSSADHRHMIAGSDTCAVVLYDVGNTIQANTQVSGTVVFRSKYIGSDDQTPLAASTYNFAAAFAAGTGGSSFPYAYVVDGQGWPVVNVGSYSFSVEFMVE